MLSAFRVKIWSGLAPKEYSIDTNVLLRVPPIGSYLSRRPSPKPRAAARWPGGSSCGHLRIVVWNDQIFKFGRVQTVSDGYLSPSSMILGEFEHIAISVFFATKSKNITIRTSVFLL